MKATKPTEHRYDFVILFDVAHGNPNGDPDAGNRPRQDPVSAHGLVSDGCLKRKIRNYVTLTRGGKPGFDIYVKDRGILVNEQKKVYEALSGEEKKKVTIDQAQKKACEMFYDIRTFGAVMTVGAGEEEDENGGKSKKLQFNCGQVRGPVQLCFANSVSPIFPQEHTITRVARTNPGDSKAEDVVDETGEVKASVGQMGRKYTVSYGLYRCHGYYSPSFAARTGFTAEDLNLLWESILNMFEHDRSSARGEMILRKLVVFKHEDSLGNAPAHKLFERVKIDYTGAQPYPQGYGDYQVEVNQDGLPQGVEVLELEQGDPLPERSGGEATPCT